MRTRAKGFTLVELLVGMAISAIAIAGIYGTYAVVKAQYDRIAAKAEIHGAGRAAIQVLSRDIRMAGYEHRDNKGVLVNGPINQSALSLDGDNRGFSVVYDYQLPYSMSNIERRKVTYRAKPFKNNKGERYQLIRTQETLVPAYKKVEGIFLDYVEDLKFSKTTESVDIVFLIRSKNEATGSSLFRPKAYFDIGSVKSDGYVREYFSMSTLPRNRQ